MLQVKELVKMQIDKEVESLQKAEDEKNLGKARVCARRASALLINYMLEKENIGTKDFSALKSLMFVYENNLCPEEVKNAISRLITKVNESDGKEISTNPLTDSLLIINFFMSN